MLIKLFNLIWNEWLGCLCMLHIPDSLQFGPFLSRAWALHILTWSLSYLMSDRQQLCIKYNPLVAALTITLKGPSNHQFALVPGAWMDGTGVVQGHLDFARHQPRLRIVCQSVHIWSVPHITGHLHQISLMINHLSVLHDSKAVYIYFKQVYIANND